MPEHVRDGNAGCVVHGPRRRRTGSVVLFFATARGPPANPSATPAPGLRWPRRHRAVTREMTPHRTWRDPRSTGARRRRPDRRARGPAEPPRPARRHPRFSCPTAHRSVMRTCADPAPRTSRRPFTAARGGPNAPCFAGKRERTGAVAQRWLCARRDRIPRTQPTVFGQLHPGAGSVAEWPDSLPPTRQERTARYAFTRRGRATSPKGTSLCASRVKRFVIERFTPRFLIDIELVGEGVTAGPRDAVDSILEIGDWGHVRHRGETCRSDRPVRTRETRTPRGA